MTHQHEFVEVSGCRIELRRGGSGEPLLYLHGAGGNVDWLPFMARLSESFDVIAPSHPGYDRSDMPDWLDRIDDLAYFYLDFLDQIGVAGVHVVGNSLGGWIAAEMAVRNPERFKSLTLVSAAGITVEGEPVADIFLWNPEEAVRNLFHDQKLADARLSHPADEETAEIQVRNRYTTARIAWQPRFHNPELQKWLHRVRMPTAVLWGEEDRIFPTAYAHAYRDLIPNADLRIVPECGHLPQIEKTDAFIETVQAVAARA